MRVLIADKLNDRVAQALEAAGCAVTVEADAKDDALEQALRTVEPQVLVVRSTKVTGSHVAAAPGLSLVIRAGAGVNTIDLDTCSSRGVYVANCPGKNAVAVAELVVGHLINCDRRIADNVADLRRGTWAKKEYGQAKGLFGRTLAVLGCGQIGEEVIVRARALGMQVRAWSRSLTPEGAKALGVEYAATPLEACRGADALTVHVAYCDATHHLVDQQVLEALAPGAYVVNAARGGVLDEAALAKAVHSRGIRAGLDVYEEEPGSSDTRYTGTVAKLPGVYGTHHIGASTAQASEAVGDEVVRIVETYLSTGRVLHCVNLASRSPATHSLVVRHRDAVGVLAHVLEQLREGGINVQEMENVVFAGGGAACATIHLSGAPAESVLAAIESADTIYAAKLVALETP